MKDLNTMSGGWCFLLIAIIFGAMGTISLKLSDGFHRIQPTLALGIFYFISFMAMTLALKKIDISIVYAIWSGVGTILVTIISVFLFREVVSLRKAFFLLLIILGIIGIHLADGFY